MLEIPEGLQLELLGLLVDTSGICLDVYAERGSAGPKERPSKAQAERERSDPEAWVWPSNFVPGSNGALPALGTRGSLPSDHAWHVTALQACQLKGILSPRPSVAALPAAWAFEGRPFGPAEPDAAAPIECQCWNESDAHRNTDLGNYRTIFYRPSPMPYAMVNLVAPL